MVAESKFAASLYQNLARLGEEKSSGAQSKLLGDDEGPNFGGMVKDVVDQFTHQARESDKQAQNMAAGKADLVDVVTAVSQTELTLETIVGVRDQIIGAYEKIMQMPI